jgi:hypothetical protein
MDKRQQLEIGQMKASIYYEGGGPCYKCYISPNGGNALHPDFNAAVPCPHRYLVLPLAYAVWSRPELRAAAETVLVPGAAWGNIRSFGKWFASPNPTTKWNSMAILNWYSKYIEP